MQQLIHTTSDGERWDQIAWRYYGDPYGYVRLLEANPAVAIQTRLPAGLRLAIPLIEEDDAQPVEALPPWKR
ncbi:tail protein X [Chromobacterium subtsugae]|uniref:Tail protein X n=1 Tax=Chromobacterium subtsugae TaxID=251747 RepID=A0ABS7FLM5_9NEIS|nr:MULTISPECIES: tail protein X [Chromobacterium]KUM02931.1 hypothetical protein Cv017_22690 [Chromobacterium subtsugae]KZE84146.1 hypothetical protein AWB61_05450 [Chromobacterium sp. F49]MBW7568673.1 tail protein X [Chromobacterium subtsugae]MBW8290365.1 tail protein X [Chromobacterium subtsugae]OBU85997.1 membrane protein [Chromobacterium subtsugae]